MKREINCAHNMAISQCDEHWPLFIAETTVGDVLEADKADGKSEAWRKAADTLIDALAIENKFLVSDMLQIYLESAGYGLLDYSPLGGVFRRASKRGTIKRIARPTKQALWYSQIYQNGKRNV